MSSIKIDRALIRDFTGNAEKALKELAESYGLAISYKGGTFARDGSDATIKYELVAPNVLTGVHETKEAKDFARLAGQFGFKPEELGRVFSVNGTEYRITGLNPRRPKYPVSAERVKDGRAFKFCAWQARGPRPDGNAKPEGLTPEIKRAFQGLSSRLSPENLSCDGECSAAETRRRHKAIKREWSALERRAGRAVSESETWSW